MADGKRIIETVEETAELPPCKTANEMEDICCEKAGELPCCKVVTPGWDGYSKQEFIDYHGIAMDDLGRDSSGYYVTIEDYPREDPCGKEETDYDVRPGSCCDGVIPVSFDLDATPDLLPAGETIVLYWSDGLPPFTVKALSQELSFYGGKRAVVTSAHSITLMAMDEFCGGAAVVVSDSCGQDVMTLRSSEGRWEYYADGCRLSGGSVDPSQITYGLLDHQVERGVSVIEGMWRQDESYYGQYTESPYLGSCDGCGTTGSIECLDCAGISVCAAGRKDYLPNRTEEQEMCLGYPKEVFGYSLDYGPRGGTWQYTLLKYCDDTYNDVAMFGINLTSNHCCGKAANRAYSYLVSTGKKIYRWVC